MRFVCAVSSALMFLSIIAIAQETAPVQRSSDPVIATIGKQKITASDFDRFYRKNADVTPKKGGTVDSAGARREFLDMLIKYRLKLAEAYRLHYDTDPEIASELKQYERNISASYYLDHKLVEPGIKLLYDRRQVELHAAHVYVMISRRRQFPAGDTLKPYQEAMDVIAQANAGVPFDSLVEKYSDDPSTKVRNGDLGYFTMGGMLPAIEDECYSLKVGEVSQHPIRSVAGYHIIKLLGRGPAHPDRLLSHIMIGISASDTPADTLKKYRRMEAILDSIKHGTPFADLAKRNSEDTQTAAEGGAIGVIGRNQIRMFDDLIFSLKVGEPSSIVRSPAGYHILMVTGERPFGTLEERREELRNMYRRMRYDADYRTLIDELKADDHLRYNDSTIAMLQSRLDTTKTTSSVNWDSTLTKADRAQVLYTYDGGSVTVDSLVSFLKQGSEFRNTPFKPESVTKMVLRLAEINVLEYATRDLEKESPEFAGIMKEYREGLMIYKLDQENVWQKVKVKDAALRTYYKKHRNEYKWGDRVEFAEIAAKTDSAARCMLDSLKAGVDFDSLAARHTTRMGMAAKHGHWGMTDVPRSLLSQVAFTMAVDSVSGPIKTDVGYSIIRTLKKDPARIKTYNEALSEVTAKYQDEMTKQIDAAFVKKLRSKFPVTVDEKAFAETVAKK